MEKQYSLYSWFKWLGNPGEYLPVIFFFNFENKYARGGICTIIGLPSIIFGPSNPHTLIRFYLIKRISNIYFQDRPSPTTEREILKTNCFVGKIGFPKIFRAKNFLK